MILEAALPRFFKGATELYRTGTDPYHNAARCQASTGFFFFKFGFKGKGLTCERPAKKSPPPKRPQPSCSSPTSGKWRTSFTSLPRSSFSSCAPTPSERRTESFTSSGRTSSMKRFIPKGTEAPGPEVAHTGRRSHAGFLRLLRAGGLLFQKNAPVCAFPSLPPRVTARSRGTVRVNCDGVEATSV